MTNAPNGLVILMNDRIYVTVRDWPPGADGSRNVGIDDLDNAFVSNEQRDGFKTAISASTGMQLDSILGNIVIFDGNNFSAAVTHPGTSVFRLENGGTHFVARALLEVGIAMNQQFSVFAITGNLNGGVLDKFFEEWATKDRGDEPNLEVNLDDLLAVDLKPVFSSVTLTKNRIASSDEGRGSENYGNARP